MSCWVDEQLGRKPNWALVDNCTTRSMILLYIRCSRTLEAELSSEIGLLSPVLNIGVIVCDFQSNGIPWHMRQCEKRWYNGSQRTIELNFKRVGPKSSEPDTLDGSNNLRTSRISDSAIWMPLNKQSNAKKGMKNRNYKRVTMYPEMQGLYHEYKELPQKGLKLKL